MNRSAPRRRSASSSIKGCSVAVGIWAIGQGTREDDGSARVPRPPRFGAAKKNGRRRRAEERMEGDGIPDGLEGVPDSTAPVIYIIEPEEGATL